MGRRVNRALVRADARARGRVPAGARPAAGDPDVDRVPPATPDKLPLIGRVAATPGCWIAAGHEGLGITTSLGTAELSPTSILGRTPPLDAAPFDPSSDPMSAHA